MNLKNKSLESECKDDNDEIERKGRWEKEGIEEGDSERGIECEREPVTAQWPNITLIAVSLDTCLNPSDALDISPH